MKYFAALIALVSHTSGALADSWTFPKFRWYVENADSMIIGEYTETTGKIVSVSTSNGRKSSERRFVEVRLKYLHLIELEDYQIISDDNLGPLESQNSRRVGIISKKHVKPEGLYGGAEGSEDSFVNALIDEESFKTIESATDLWILQRNAALDCYFAYWLPDRLEDTAIIIDAFRNPIPQQPAQQADDANPIPR